MSQLAKNASPLWERCGPGMRVGDGGLAVVKDEDEEYEFGVVISGPLSKGRVQELEVQFSTGGKECRYWALGVAAADVPLDTSLRRVARGRAWFLHNRGFLCDGPAFEDDSLPPVGLGERVLVVLDPERARLSFSVGGDFLGSIEGVEMEQGDLRFMAYMTADTCCTITAPLPPKPSPPLQPAALPVHDAQPRPSHGAAEDARGSAASALGAVGAIPAQMAPIPVQMAPIDEGTIPAPMAPVVAGWTSPPPPTQGVHLWDETVSPGEDDERPRSVSSLLSRFQAQSSSSSPAPPEDPPPASLPDSRAQT
eukprot:CAMPEP_0180228916 /NCGR_PEP_ID=MMETSP0987-20121128/25085_1 /TAXON_ID=697907 /ORGANISM="non described non described, Strain CCMP2293" /LENGTH=308 /DNA_ID=CAMNT_0022193275 /DNA_START=113 /DNA_END=1035 /DNA_ORIENTATION=-